MYFRSPLTYFAIHDTYIPSLFRVSSFAIQRKGQLSPLLYIEMHISSGTLIYLQA